MAKNKIPVTAAIRYLRENQIDFSSHLYAYEEKGGTAVSARELDVDEHAVIKTLVMEDETGQPFIILMHGDCEVSTKSLAREIGCKFIQPCSPETAMKQSGYQVGGTSPFGTRKKMPIYAEASIFELEKIYINGGKRGFLVGMTPDDLGKTLDVSRVSVAQPIL
jgi:Cys-tRNA(Pro) deacylase